MVRCETFLNYDMEGRRHMVREKGLCFNCLRPGHRALNCTSKFRCRVDGCGRTHHTALHNPINRDEPLKKPSTATTSATAFVTDVKRDASGVQIVAVRILGEGGKQASVYGLLDTGSSTSFIDSNLANRLQLTGKLTNVALSTLGGDSSVTGTKVSFRVEAALGPAKPLTVHAAVALAHLNVGKVCLPPMSEWGHLSQVTIPRLADNQVRVIIGTNVPHAFLPHESVHGGESDPVAIRTPLGWSLMGPLGGRVVNYNLFAATEPTNGALQGQLDQMFALEMFCVAGNKDTFSKTDRAALALMDEATCLKAGHYEVPMLWRTDCPSFPDNKALAIVRLRCLKAKLSKNPELYCHYKAVIEDYLAKGYARECPEEATVSIKSTRWYLPHHPVQNPNKPGKVRVVFDAAACYKGTSLNRQLEQGPDLTKKLVGVLLRFREQGVAVMADIEAMFHQVRVMPPDAEALCFLWWPAGLDGPIRPYQMLSHIFGATCSPCCANYALGRAISDNESEYSSCTIQAARTSFYVDDFLHSSATAEEAVHIAQETRELVAKGGFKLTKWKSNSATVEAAVTDTGASKSVEGECGGPPRVERALGILWNLDNDSFMFRPLIPSKPNTKRGILSAISSIYDPLGLLAPVSLQPKRILQQAWQQGIGWDDTLPAPLIEEWRSWQNSLDTLGTVELKRCYGPIGEVATQLHVFCDASEEGYGCAAYLRMEAANSALTTSLVFGKSRVAPVKAISIPRLELQAALLGSRIATMLTSELRCEVEDLVLWTD